MLLEYYEKA